MLAGGHRAGEGDLAGRRVRGHPLAELVAAGDDVEHARREDLAEDLAHQQGAAGREGRRLEDHRVAGQQGRGDLPGRQDDREVPGGDGGDDAHRTAHHLGVGRGVVLDDLAGGLQVGEVLQPEAGGQGLDARRGEGLALLGGEDRADPLARREHGVRRLRQRGPAGVLVRTPVDERLRRGLEGLVQLLAAAVGGLGVDLAGGGVHDPEGRTARPRARRRWSSRRRSCQLLGVDRMVEIIRPQLPRR